MGFWVAFAVSFAITGLMTALNYVLRSHIKTPSTAFDSPTYSTSGMKNVVQPGYPVNVQYGRQEVPPTLINWFKRSKNGGEETWLYLLCSLGEGPIGGVKYAKINDAKIQEYYGENKDYEMYISHGEQEPIVYKFRSVVKATVDAVDFNARTIDFTLNKKNKTFQQGEADVPGYVYVQNAGFVRYNDSVDNGDKTGQLRLCHFPPGTVEVGTVMKQYYKVYKKDGNVTSLIPHNKNTTLHTEELEQVISGGNWSTTYTTQNKIHAFYVTVALRKGIYRFDDKDGYEKEQLTLRIQWKPSADSWDDNYTTESVNKAATNDDVNVIGSGLTLRLKQNKKYCYLANADGSVLKGAEATIDEEYDFSEFNFDEKKYYLEFTAKNEEGVSTDYRYLIDKVETERTGGEDIWVEDDTYYNGERLYGGGYYSPEVKVKIKFKKQTGPETNKNPKFPGADQNGIAYKITRDRTVGTNIVEYELPQYTAVKLSDFEVTYFLPLDDDDYGEPLEYGYYDIRVKKVSNDITDEQKGQNELTLVSIQEATTDRLIYPYEGLLSIKAKMNEAINGEISSVKAYVEGTLIKDVTEDGSGVSAWAADTTYNLNDRRKLINGYIHRVVSVKGNQKSSSSLPDVPRMARSRVEDNNVTWEEDSCRVSDNPLDIEADITTNERYSRGKYLNYDQQTLDDLYSKYAHEVSYADNEITENDPVTGEAITRKRFSINVNIDSRRPIMDTIQGISKCFKGYNYWDGRKMCVYIDRYRTPVAMFNDANITPGSLIIKSTRADDQINRYYAQYLNKDKGYEQDQTGRSSSSEGFDIEKLQETEINMYPLTEEWYVQKILKYLLRFAYYNTRYCEFETSLDGVSVEPGQLFYLSGERMKKYQAQCGRIMAVSANAITLDKAYTFAGGNTYKVLLRKDDFTPVEYTVDLTATGTGAKTVVVFTTSISSISKNSIYSLGRTDSGNEYYRQFLCIFRRFEGNKVRIAGLLFTKAVFEGVYENDPVTEEQGTSTSSSVATTQYGKLERHNRPPRNIRALMVKENPKEPGSLIIWVQKPRDNTTWAYAMIHAEDEQTGLWRFIDRTTGDPVIASGFELGKTYTIRATSYTSKNVHAASPVEVEITLDGTNTLMAPPRVSGMRVLYKKGNETEVAGEDFEIEWDPVSTFGDDSANQQVSMSKQGYDENIRYLVEWYYSAISSNVKLNGKKVNETVAYSEEVYEPRAKFTLARNIESIKKMWENYSTHSSYSGYYGIPQRTVKAKVYTVDAYGKMSSPKEIILTNPAPQMQDKNGSLLILTLESLKSGARIEFAHPYQEYDIKYFARKHFKAAEWIANTAYQEYDIIYDPTTNEIYYCSPAGTSGASKPDFSVYGGSYGVWPSVGTLINDNTAKWNKVGSSEFFELGKSWTVLYSDGTRVNLSDILVSKSVPSIVGISNTDSEIVNTKYTQDEYVMDTKYYYFFGVIPIDPFGRDTSQIYNYAYGGVKPGLTDDDAETKISAPSAVTLGADPLTHTTYSLQDGSEAATITFQYNTNSETDIEQYEIQVRATNKIDAVIGDLPTLAEIQAKSKNIGGTDYDVFAQNYFLEHDDTESTQSFSISGYSGWTFYYRIRAINYSGLKSSWSSWYLENILGDTLFGAALPNAPSLGLVTGGIEISLNMSNPPLDFSGYRVAVKAGTSFTNDADRAANEVVFVPATKNNPDAKTVFYGTKGTEYCVSARGSDYGGNAGGWKDALVTAVVTGVKSEDLPIENREAHFSGSLSATAYNQVSWGIGTLYIKTSTGASTYSIASGNSGAIASTRALVWDESAPTVFTLQTLTTYFSSSGLNKLLIAILEPASNSAEKCKIIPKIDIPNIQLNSSQLSVNKVSNLTNDLGNITAGQMNFAHNSGAEAAYKDDAGDNRIYFGVVNGNVPIGRVSKAGYNAKMETNPLNLIWDIRFNNFKIVQSNSLLGHTFPAYIDTSPYIYEQEAILATVTAIESGALAYIYDPATKRVYPLPHIFYTTQERYEYIWIEYYRVESGWIKVKRKIVCADSTGWNCPARTLDLHSFLITGVF